MKYVKTFLVKMLLPIWMGLSVVDASVDSQAITNQGSAYYYGNGVPQDRDKGCQLFHKAAVLGEKHAMFNLGNCYREGVYFDLDLEAASEWYKKSYSLGYSTAIVSYSMLVFFDNPEVNEMPWAYEELKKHENDHRALFILGVIHSKGMVVDRNYEKAISYYEQSAYKKNLIAAALLSYIYEYGAYHQSPSPSKAAYWKGVFNTIGLFEDGGEVQYEDIIASLKKQELGID